MVRITVDCQKPKYAKGYFEVSKFEDIFHWLGTIKGLPKGEPSRRVYYLVKTGHAHDYTDREAIEMRSDFFDRSLALEVGEMTGLVR